MTAAMAREHQVIIDKSVIPANVSFTPVFNVAAAYIVPKDPAGANDDAMVAELQQCCKTNLAGFKYPRWFHFVEALPKTVTGKIQRFKPASRYRVKIAGDLHV